MLCGGKVKQRMAVSGFEPEISPLRVTSRCCCYYMLHSYYTVTNAASALLRRQTEPRSFATHQRFSDFHYALNSCIFRMCSLITVSSIHPMELQLKFEPWSPVISASRGFYSARSASSSDTEVSWQHIP
jgi:hypothetical protein